MNEVKYMVIYMDNSCEVHFDSLEGAKLILSPCGSEFVYRTYSDNVIKNTLKYRTAYAISLFSSKLTTILRERNRFCDDRPFVSPILLENDQQLWLSSDNFREARWSLETQRLETRANPIEIDYANFFYIWRSECKNVEAKLHFNRNVFLVKYPIRLPAYLNDEYDQKCSKMYAKFKNKHQKQENSSMSKHINKYTWNEQEFSANHLPPLWEDLHTAMLQLIHQFHEPNKTTNFASDEIVVKLPEAMPLSCSSTHLHRFDAIELSSEPKVIYLNKTWYKLYYKNKSIEILCPPPVKTDTDSNEADENSNYAQDYLVSDSLTGRYYTCYSLNKRTGDIEETKICVETIPSFKTYLQKTINYANILLKRITSIKHLSNYSTCYISKKFEEIEPKEKHPSTNTPSISIESLQMKEKSSSLISNDSSQSLLHASSNPEIKKQYVIEDVGHFKYFRNNSVLINFVDKVKLYFDDYSIKMYLRACLEKCTCCIYLPDNSQHEISLTSLNDPSDCFGKYLSFLDQWLNWLLTNKVIARSDECNDEKMAHIKEENLDMRSLQAHLSQLKLFNYTMNNSDESVISLAQTKTDDQLSIMSVSSLLKENSQFLKNISQKK